MQLHYCKCNSVTTQLSTITVLLLLRSDPPSLVIFDLMKICVNDMDIQHKMNFANNRTLFKENRSVITYSHAAYELASQSPDGAEAVR